MIRTLRGTIIEREANAVTVEVNGVGYLVHCAPGTITDEGGETFIWVYQSVSDDRINLYGFSTKDDVMLFEQLLAVSGIGPKKALAIMSATDAASLRRAIVSGETKQVSDATGVGKKVADKIILELQNKVEERDGDDVQSPTAGDSETIEALTSLGYSTKEARDAVKHISEDVTDTSDRIREALKVIGS